MQPVIGITMSHDDYDLIRKGIEYSYIRREYGAQIRAAGGQPIFLESHLDPATAAQLCDGIVISGGEDIDPAFYGQKQRAARVLEPADRTEWERKLIDACDTFGVRILGICYGNQLLNVHYGGTLYQDIAEETGSSLSHGTTTQAAMHRVRFEQDFLGFEKGDFVLSAARHHQAIKDLASGFKVVARAEDGIVEAIAGRGHFGVQWHSESDGTADKIYGEFVGLCAGQIEPATELVAAPQPL